MSDKASIRQRLLSQRLALDASTVQNLSQFIQAAVLESNPYRNSRCLAVYDAIRHEVATDKIIQDALQSDKEVCFPHWNPDNAEIRFYHVTDLDELELKAWGTREPVPSDLAHRVLEEIDLVLVPGIAFDKDGYRLGYGYGGYDRILGTVANRAWGLSYDCQIVDSLPAETHDIPCTRVITEKRLIQNQ